MPDHLVRPPIDEEALMRVRAREKMRQLQPQQFNRKISLADQKAQKEAAKSKSEVNIKIKRAEKNVKLLFAELKKVLDKPDEDVVFNEAP